MNWPGGAAISFLHGLHRVKLTYAVAPLISILQMCNEAQQFLSIFIFGTWSEINHTKDVLLNILQTW